MRLQNPFAAINTTGIDSQILVVLARTEQYLTVAEIHQLIPEDGSIQGIRKALTRLAQQGTVLERFTGRSAGYALNRQHLLAQSILNIANIKSTLIDRVSQEIFEWEVQPFTAQLFGSAARGDMSNNSDIDLLIVMPLNTDRDTATTLIDKLANQVHMWTGNDVRPLLYFEHEVASASIFDSILREGINVVGDPAWLRRQLRAQTGTS